MEWSRWPAALPARAVRFARSSRRLPESSRFYREIVGLPQLAEFHDHDGYDGVVFALPDSSVQLELVTPPRPTSPQDPDPEDALLIHLAEAGAAATLRERLRSAELESFAPENPYWTRRGVFGALDPDGRPVLFVPASEDQDDPSDADRADAEAEVTASERAFFDALVAADVATLDGVLADDFLIVDVLAGQVATRADLLGALSTGLLRFTSVAYDDSDVRVRFHGAVAVSVGSTSMTMELAGVTTQVEGRFTHLHLRTPDGYRLLSAQGTQIRNGPLPSRDDTSEVEIARYDGSHRDLIDLFRLAEDSESALDRYIDLGTVWVARDESGTVVGHLQSVVRDDGLVREVVNTAVVETWRGRGVGRRLLDHAVAEARRNGARHVELATGAADAGNLRFYQRCGFRMSRVVRDAFVPATGYPEPIVIDGIPLRDQVWFELDL
jgi:GNAT superfamily N-acetyltransferase/ketosteroid isomerase-like protein